MRNTTAAMTLFCLSLSLTLSHAMSSAASSVAEKPNIVLILADDMGPGEPSHEGGIIPTPALDRMANEGMRFTDAHTSSSVCTPTRYGILTGRYNWRSRLKSGVLTRTDSKALMDPKRLSLGKMLQQQGYHTGCVGKWHLGVDWVLRDKDDNPEPKKKTFNSWKVDYAKPFKNGPVDIGFNEAFFILASLDMPPYLYLRNNKSLSIPTVNKSFPHNEYNDYQRIGAAAEDFDASTCLADFARESRKYIAKQAKDKSRPFFLYLPLTSPHTPITPGKAFKGKYKQYSWYADFMAETDWVVAQVLEQLAQSGVDKNTLVIFTSDNGFAPYVMIPKMIEAGYRPSGPYRSAKASLYEGGHRVPFLVRWPAKVKAGATSDVTICTTDFFATFADILGVKDTIPDNAAEDSFSFYPCLQGKGDQVRPFTIHHSISGAFAIRKGDYKLLLSTGGAGGWNLPWKKVSTPSKLVQLYNLKDDPGETNNLEESHPDKIKELIDDLAKAIRDGRTTPGEKQSNEGWPKRPSKGILAKYPQLKGD